MGLFSIHRVRITSALGQLDMHVGLTATTGVTGACSASAEPLNQSSLRLILAGSSHDSVIKPPQLIVYINCPHAAIVASSNLDKWTWRQDVTPALLILPPAPHKVLLPSNGIDPCSISHCNLFHLHLSHIQWPSQPLAQWTHIMGKLGGLAHL